MAFASLKVFTQLLIWGVILSVEAVHASALIFPNLIFAEDRVFYATAPTEAVRANLIAPVNLIVLKEALRECALSEQQVTEQFQRWLHPKSALNLLLEDLLSRGVKDLGHHKVNLAITSFGERRTIFKSATIFNFPVADETTSFLDCALPALGEATLAHELVHVLLQARGMDAWLEEGLGQFVEEALGNESIQRAVERLEKAGFLPPLYEKRRPFYHSSNYPLAFLYFRYLSERWGGRNTLRAFFSHEKVEGCIASDFLAEALCRVQKHVATLPELSRYAEKVTAPGLLRFFAVALTLNTPTLSLYNIPGWSGFRSPPQAQVQQQMIAPGQILRLSLVNRTVSFNPQLEVYRLIANDHQFKIARELNGGSLPHPEKDFILVLNTTDRSHPLFRE